MTECLHWECSEKIEDTKLFCEVHWGLIPPEKQVAIFEAWTFGELEGLREMRNE